MSNGARTRQHLAELESLGCIEARRDPDGTLGFYTTPLGDALLEAP